MLRLTKLFGFGTLTVLVIGVSIPAVTHALSGSDWRSGNIIDDSIFYNSNDMSVSDIQNFLNSKLPSCDTNGTKIYSGSQTRAQYANANNKPKPPYRCLKDYYENTSTKANNLSGGTPSGAISAAQIIKNSAATHGVSTRALLILLQKEQSLVTDDWPWPNQYRSATGYGCPDTAACDSQYFGFYNQVNNAARQFKLYANNPSGYRYKPYQTNYIQYNPNASCGGTNVYIENKATAGLYNYTPYQPNASALNNLYGSGDSCGAYGNRNFWRLFNDWFGSTYSGQRPPSLGNKLTAVTQASGKINVFIRGTDNRLWQQWFQNGAWSTSWNYIDGPAESSAPSAISYHNGHMDIFEINNGKLRHKWYLADSTAWRNWETLGQPNGVSLTNVSAVSQTSGKINVFARGSDGRLWQRWFQNGAWSTSWNYIDGPSNTSSAPSGISYNNGHMDVFEIKDGALRHNWYNADPTAWRGWSNLGQPAGVRLARVSAVSQTSGKINVFARGSDGRLWQRWFQNGAWSTSWNYIDGPSAGSSAPAAISFGNGHMDIFETKDGYFRHNWYNADPTAWRGWSRIY